MVTHMQTFTASGLLADFRHSFMSTLTVILIRSVCLSGLA